MSLLEPFADALVIHDMPGLPAERRAESVEFALARIASMPGPTRVGVAVLAVALRALMVPFGALRIARLLAPVSAPLLGEYVRLHRSLVYAYVWETWPDTQPDGTPG